MFKIIDKKTHTLYNNNKNYPHTRRLTMAIQITKQDGNYILNIPSRYDGEINIIIPRPPANPNKLAGHYRRHWRLFIPFKRECFFITFKQLNLACPHNLKNKNRMIEKIFNAGAEKHFWRTWRTK